MGANASTYENSSSYNVKNSSVRGSSNLKTPRILEFHSSARWKAHFEASKGTSKMVCLCLRIVWTSDLSC